MPPSKSKELEAMLMKRAASKDVGGGVLAELSALTACAHLSDKARHELSIALQKLENMKLPPKPKVEGEDDKDEEDEADNTNDSETPDTDTKVVMFPDKSLGLRMEKTNAEAFVGDSLFNARIQTVKSKEAI